MLRKKKTSLYGMPSFTVYLSDCGGVSAVASFGAMT